MNFSLTNKQRPDRMCRGERNWDIASNPIVGTDLISWLDGSHVQLDWSRLYLVCTTGVCASDNNQEPKWNNKKDSAHREVGRVKSFKASFLIRVLGFFRNSNPATFSPPHDDRHPEPDYRRHQSGS